MRYKLFFLLLLLAESVAFSAPKEKPYKGTFYNEENRITLTIDLYVATVVASNYSFLGKLNGYMSGNIYDVWFVTSSQITDDGKAQVSMSNDLGADTQKILLSINEKGQLLYEAQGPNAIRKAVGRKWQKAPAKMIFVEK